MFTDLPTSLQAFSVSSFLEYPESVKLYRTGCFSTSSTNFKLIFCSFIFAIGKTKKASLSTKILVRKLKSDSTVESLGTYH